MIRSVRPLPAATVYLIIKGAASLGASILGIVATTSSIRTALAVSGAILSPVLLLYARAFGEAEGARAPADKKCPTAE